jgi:hypothetical protein
MLELNHNGWIFCKTLQKRAEKGGWGSIPMTKTGAILQIDHCFTAGKSHCECIQSLDCIPPRYTTT